MSMLLHKRNAEVRKGKYRRGDALSRKDALTIIGVAASIVLVLAIFS